MNEDALPSYETYLEIQKAIGSILTTYPRSHAYFDFFRSIKGREAYQKWKEGKKLSAEEIKSFMTISVNPVHSTLLTSKQYERLIQMYRSSAIKISMIDENLKNWLESSSDSERILSTGGGCALESIDTKRIIELYGKDKNLVTKYIEEMYLRFPTWTQITGALIPTRLSIFYDETFPWHFKISEYGIANAESKTQRVYDRLFFALQRFAKLHNPQNIVLRLPFTALNLDVEGKLRQWFEMYNTYISKLEKQYKLEKKSHDPDTDYKAWIQYTYFGPEILETALAKIKREYPQLYEVHNLDSSTIHVRGKQIDHFDIERLNLWMHKTVLDEVIQKKRVKKLLGNTHTRDLNAMYMWNRDNLKNTKTIGSAGFLDFQYKGKLVHEDRLFSLKEIQSKSTKEIMAELTDSPLRLHSRNLPKVLQLLERFKNPYSISFSKEMILQLSNLNSKLDQKERKIATLKQFISYTEFFISLLEKILKNKRIVEFSPANEIQGKLTFLIGRYRSNNNLLKFATKDSIDKPQRMLQLEALLIKMLKLERDGEKTQVTIQNIELAQAFHDELIINLSEDTTRRDDYIQETELFIKKIKSLTHDISDNIIKYEADALTTHVNILPLADNLFVSYMQQLLFIPSIQNAFLDMVSISNNRNITKENKEQLIVEIINKIYYVVEACLLYIFKNTSYPWEARFESHYDRQY